MKGRHSQHRADKYFKDSRQRITVFTCLPAEEEGEHVHTDACPRTEIEDDSERSDQRERNR